MHFTYANNLGVLHLGPVHTNPVSSENVLLRFQKDLRPHLSFSPDQERSHMVASARHFDTHSLLVWCPVVPILMTSPFSPSTLENSVFKKHRFQTASLWRAFPNGSVFGDRFRRFSVDDSRIGGKTAPFWFENELVWTGPY